MKSGLRIAVIGYGSGGQAAAILLSRDDHRVEVFERVAQPGPVGAGFLLQPVGLQVLWEMGLLDAVLAHGAPIRRLFGRTVRGRAVMDMRYGDLDARLFGLGLQRGALFELFDAAWTEGRCLHAGRAITQLDVEQGVLTDAQGRRHEGFDLIVVADGSASQLRSQVAPARFDRAYPWGAQWCLVEQGAWSWPDELQQRYVAARAMAGMLPVGTRPSDPTKRLSFFWSLPGAALAKAVDAPSWRRELRSVWPETAAQLADVAVTDALAPARYRDTVQRSWFRDRAVLLGDAAHAMSPQLGQGVNMALLDALALRDALRMHASVGESLAAYQHERRAHLGIYHFWSRWLTPLFQSDRRWGPALRDALFHPLSRWPGGRGQMLRVLTGTRRGWWGRMPLSDGFLDALAARALSSPHETSAHADAEGVR
ncbi:FAD-dependent oxidoreductase [Oleiagrimonas soli]|uniref:2-polyprenyl-6-methoxyphenol hydroxylase-like FAD-dependent oxidoreductase n=1 Tax=Oleiagrimonas soli TaxID=1543381 RepID=A0A099CWI1_9GAMM|nr:NAD(P)/FAD-dependent oxidoreductase [Oleiagrimonas soli]KGI78089.1 monooxygenase [Oleiagrimonas soli]MBB6183489.1 2-polyprenyl-6-methoxyphenol hydroxylase-like FAD-dependent oxidoreductase [Oleiagrimonas soli]